MKKYKPAKHPKTGAWHIVGYIGNGQYMELSGPFQSILEAEAWITIQHSADRDSRREASFSDWWVPLGRNAAKLAITK
jgi:hypothetical protein